jgi:hypothetical protein
MCTTKVIFDRIDMVCFDPNFSPKKFPFDPDYFFHKQGIKQDDAGILKNFLF